MTCKFQQCNVSCIPCLISIFCFVFDIGVMFRVQLVVESEAAGGMVLHYS